MSRLFGWSYPPGCSGPPEDEEPVAFRCKHCGSFLVHKPTEIKSWEDKIRCTGEDCDGLCGGPMGKHEAHDVIGDSGMTLIFKCKRCTKSTSVG